MAQHVGYTAKIRAALERGTKLDARTAGRRYGITLKQYQRAIAVLRSAQVPICSTVKVVPLGRGKGRMRLAFHSLARPA